MYSQLKFHFYLGIVFITSSITALRVTLRIANVLHLNYWDAQLSLNLAIAASLRTLSLLCIRLSNSALFVLSSHVGRWFSNIFIIADNNSFSILNHRDVILGHLLWVSIALGLHSFSLYIHNDQAFGRREDIFDDNSIQFKPLLRCQIKRLLR